MSFEATVDIKLTAHARQRMTEMGVERHQLRSVVLDPDTVVPANQTRDKHGNPCERTAAYGRRHMYSAGHVSVVVDDSDPARLVVVTILPHTCDLYERAS